jgi:ribosomal protein L16 Arg81 hydroxylase
MSGNDAQPESGPRAASDAASMLQWIIHPFSTRQFLTDHWEQRACIARRGHPDYFAALLSLDEIDRVLTTLDRRYPEVTLKSARQPLGADDYTVDGRTLDVARVYQLFNEGATITLAFLDSVLPTLQAVCRGLELELSCPLQANVYLTPRQAQGAKRHYDTHDVFVLQVVGSKRWRLYDSPLVLPLPGQEFDPAVHVGGAPTQEFELQAGDAAYIPRGLLHDACAIDSTSLHVTLGVLRYTWTDLILELVASVALQEPEFRKALPPGFARDGFDRAPARHTLQRLLQEVCAHADGDAMLDHFIERFIADCPPPLRDQLTQITALAELTDESLVGARPGTAWRLHAGEREAMIESYGRRITLPPNAAEAVEFALHHPQFAVRELPGGLDEAGRLTLVRRLIREGLLRYLPSRPKSHDDSG